MNPSLILHPVSYSSSGKSALSKALALARLYQADLHILELRARRVFSNGPIVRPIRGGGVEPHLADFVESVGAAGVRVSVAELAGNAVTVVVDYARQASADFVVVAANARSHGPYWRSGAYANDLARHLSCPVLSVPVTPGGDALQNDLPFRSVLGVTGLPDVSATVVGHASSLACQTGARLAFVQAVTSRSILETASNKGSDLIIIGRRDRGATHHVIMNSTTAKVLRDAPCSVLVVPPQGTEPTLIRSDSTAAATGAAQTLAF
jgi:nucleotide-binding universal stress UspA family protein